MIHHAVLLRGLGQQRCVVRFHRSVFSLVPAGKAREVATMLKAIHAQEGRAEAKAKIELVADKFALTASAHVARYWFVLVLLRRIPGCHCFSVHGRLRSLHNSVTSRQPQRPERRHLLLQQNA